MICSSFTTSTTKRTLRHGYVLVAALALLVLAATLMVGFSRAAFQHVLRARDVQTDLQKRWGEITCRNAVLPYAEGILLTAEEQQQKALPVYRIGLSLGNESFELTLSDEQAKANLNALLEAADVETVENRVQQALIGTGLGNRLKLRPALNPATRPTPSTPTTQGGTLSAASIGPPEWITGFGQIVGSMPPEVLISTGSTRTTATDLLTCWGDGSINLRRVSETAFKLAAAPPLSGTDVSRLIGYRDQSYHGKAKASKTPANTKGLGGGDSTASLMIAAGANDKHRLGMPPLHGTSTCFSLWIVVHTARRDWYSLTVMDSADENRPRTELFVW